MCETTNVYCIVAYIKSPFEFRKEFAKQQKHFFFSWIWEQKDQSLLNNDFCSSGIRTLAINLQQVPLSRKGGEIFLILCISLEMIINSSVVRETFLEKIYDDFRLPYAWVSLFNISSTALRRYFLWETNKTGIIDCEVSPQTL